MLIKSYIFNDIETITSGDTVSEALRIAEEFSLTHVIVVQDGIWKGNLNFYEILEAKPETKIESLIDRLDNFYTQEHINIFEAINFFQSNQSNIVPVLSGNGAYTGYILLDDIFNLMSKFPLIVEPAALITIRVSQVNYNMSEITQIAESNNARVYGAFISKHIGDSIEVTIKLNAESIDSVIEAYERYGYVIVYQSQLGDREDLMKDRFQQLMKFIDV